TPDGGKRFRLQLDGVDITGRVSVPTSGSWSEWITVKTKPIRVAAGNHVLRFQTPTGGFDLDYIAVTPAGQPQYVRLAWFQNPPDNGDLATLAANFHDYIFSALNDDVRDELRARGARGPFLQYMHSGVIHNPWSCTAEPLGNQVAYRPGDFCRISEEHPDWFLRDADGEPIADGGFYFMDPASPGWRAFWIERVREMHAGRGWDGLFLDNIDATLGRFRKIGRYPVKYRTDARWQEAVTGQLRYLAVNYFQPEDVYVVGNITAVAEPTPWFNYLQFLDGAMEEGWGTDWNDRYYSVEQWEEHLQRVERTQALGKLAVLVAQGTEEDYTRERFAFASYLLVTDGLATFRYTHKEEYGEIWLYKNYSYDLGAPKGPRYRDGSSWRRDFERGYVRVNPSTHSSEIKVLAP
ncbi:MAG TPA: putative glycoside hydrolase, partial [Ardenticatenaceae bacterium]|nr:putative glycoside hydrolase [Ardenticatenaceae bacterium]